MVENRFKKVAKKGLKYHSIQPKLSDTEAAVLHYLTNDFMTIKQCSIRRGCSVQAIYKIRNNLIKKGLISKGFKKVEKNQCTFKPFNGIRLHGQEFNIKIIYKPRSYSQLINKIMYIDGNTVRCYRDSIEVYSNTSFEGSDEHKATANSMKYWQRFFYRLENDLKVILIKSRKQNIMLVKAHYAEINNEMAREAEVSGDKIKIYAEEDGKLWFMIDNSFNLFEAETQHKETSKRDIGIVRKHLNDWRNNNPPINSDLMNNIKHIVDLMKQQQEINKETAAGLNAVTTYLKSQLPQEASNDSEVRKRPDYLG